ncbi:YkvA family protein [Clostridium sp.]|uniref:YkvA family protein n=1 Tax=Clostridium sp. TaxID=1506 RepID=UPI003D6D1DC3
MKENKKLHLNKLSKKNTPSSLLNKIVKISQKAGINVVYAGLLLFYVLQKPFVPKWAKATITSALGYLIFPVDVIPDFTPAIGYSDDLGVLALAIVAVAMFIDDNVKKKSKVKLKSWFGEYKESILKDIDNRINENRKPIN